MKIPATTGPKSDPIATLSHLFLSIRFHNRPNIKTYYEENKIQTNIKKKEMKKLLL